MGREDLPYQREGEPVNDGDGTEGVSTPSFDEAFKAKEAAERINEQKQD